MGSLNDGPYGGLSGKVGNLVYYNLKGKNVVRKVGYSSKPPTPAKLANYQKMKVVNEFLRPILGFINVGFELAVAGTLKNPHNEALSYNKKFAMQGEYPNISMDYPKALVSMGDLEPAENAAVALHPDGIEFTWYMPADIEWNRKNDRAMLLLYFPDDNSCISVLIGATRAACRDFISLAPAYLTKPVQAYMAFASADRKSMSNSVWVEGS